MTTENKNESVKSQPREDYNIFRDSALRFMGYANEVGESFRYQAS
jgi:hypothetical protein